MFKVTVSKNFKASHALRNYRGGNESMHEHLWKCEVEVSAPKPDNCGCVVDFKDLDQAINSALSQIENKEINRHSFFADRNPSTENVALYLYNTIARNVFNITKVTVWEDENHSASYSLGT